MDYRHKYIKYKIKYIQLKQSYQLGGKSKTAKNKFQSNKSITTYELTLTDEPKSLKLTDLQTFKKIGSFNADNGIVIGEFDFTKLPTMKNGVYNAYKVNNSLLIAHNDVDLTKNKLSKIIFKNSGKGVGVDGGTFGFYDADIVNNKNKYPDINVKKYPDNGIIIKENDIIGYKKSDKPIGVLMTTSVGDGGFTAYLNNNSIALLYVS